VALGTTAETATLSENEKHKIVRFIVDKVAKRIPVVVGMGGNSTQSVVQSIRDFDLTGTDGILVVTPYYNKPTQEGIYKHYKAVSEASQLPVILYNVPSRTGVNMEAETVIRLANECNNIVAIKEASGILSQLAIIEKYTSDDFLLISGDDVLALPIIAIGGKGVISVIANSLPQKVSLLIHKALEGDFLASKDVHMELVDLVKLIFKEGNPGGVKAMMNHQGIVCNIMRLPLVPVSEALNKQLKEAFEILK
jgi:4-hydroxy-tetrahydrodipicolinate synthase